MLAGASATLVLWSPDLGPFWEEYWRRSRFVRVCVVLLKTRVGGGRGCDVPEAPRASLLAQHRSKGKCWAIPMYG